MFTRRLNHRKILTLQSGRMPVHSADTGRTVNKLASSSEFYFSVMPFKEPLFIVLDSASLAYAVAWLCKSNEPDDLDLLP